MVQPYYIRDDSLKLDQSPKILELIRQGSHLFLQQRLFLYTTQTLRAGDLQDAERPRNIWR